MGIANFITKDRFLHQGLTFGQPSGFNNVNSGETGSTFFSETSLRLAKAVNRKWAFKINGSFMKGTDWYADNRTDLNPTANVSTGLTGALNPGKDQVNVYADESGNRRTLTLGGKQYVVSRTGYAEKDATDYSLQNIKGDGSIFFRPNHNLEIVYTYRAALQNNIYRAPIVFGLIIMRPSNMQLRSSHRLFNSKPISPAKTPEIPTTFGSMAENVDRGFKTNNAWFTDFSNQYNSSISSRGTVSGPWTLHAPLLTKEGCSLIRLRWQNQTNLLRNVNNWDYGAALRVNASMFHTEFQHDVTNLLLKNRHPLNLMYGLDYRDYIIVPDGNYFINPTEPGKNLNYWKAGGFVQVTTSLLNEKLKVNAVIHVYKNQYFDPKVNPRLALVYSPTRIHNFRFSAQNGYRFPSIFEAFSNINSGGRKRIGGLPVMSSGVFESSYTQASISSFQKAVQTDVNTGGLTLNNAIFKEQGLLKNNPYTYLQPEQVTSFEVGYRTTLMDGRLKLDVDTYYNIYRNLMAQLDANVPKSLNPDSTAYYLQNNSKQNLYRLWTNSKTVSYNYGATLGVSYALFNNYNAGGNFPYAKLARKDQSDGLEDGFNTPEWTYNLFFGTPNLYKFVGFNINFRRQASYLWQSALATGNVSSYSTIDAQLSTAILNNKVNIKVGTTNFLNQYYYSFIGGPSIGGFYYVNVVYAF